jgi:TldD protein
MEMPFYRHGLVETATLWAAKGNMPEELLEVALDTASGPGVRFADVRLFTHHRFEYVSVRNGQPAALTLKDESGLGVRVLREKGWGFAATTTLTRPSVKEAARWARDLAKLAERTGSSIPFAEESELPRNGSYETPLREDPFKVPLEEKVGMLMAAEKSLHTGPSIKTGEAVCTSWQEEKRYLSTEGASYTSKMTHVGAGVSVTAVGGGEVQRRSYPTSFGGDFAQGGFEHVRDFDLMGHAEECGKTGEALLNAPSCPKGKMNLVLASDQLALQVHESVGHATELDRILAYEAGYAGTSFVKAEERERLRYGSPQMTVVADATVPNGLGTFGWDDEGVPAQKTTLVEEGILVGFLSSRETAARRSLQRSGGTMRGDGPLRMPLIRMTNINLVPGDRSKDELVEEAGNGLYMETNVSWSIDDKRLNFQFGCEVGRLIRNGELTELVRNPMYSGMTPAFWGSLKAKGDEKTYHHWGIPNCGKGQPSQVMHVGHGAPMGLFTDVKIGGAV